MSPSDNSPKGRNLRDRPAPEALILIFGVVIAIVLLVEAVALIILAFTNPDAVSKLSGIFQAQIQIVLGAVLGYATGRAVKDPPDA